MRLTVRKFGDSLGVRLPSQAIHALRVREGDCLCLTEAPGGFRLTPYDPEFERTMEVAENFILRYENARRDLAR